MTAAITKTRPRAGEWPYDDSGGAHLAGRNSWYPPQVRTGGGDQSDARAATDGPAVLFRFCIACQPRVGIRALIDPSKC